MVQGYPFNPTAGGFYASTSAATPASGTMSDPTLSGPYCVQHQDSTIDYCRVPQGLLLSASCTLNSATQTHAIHDTHLIVRAAANYSKRKVYGSYSTSSYQQPQKFQINAVSADHLGNTYGDLSGGASGTAMGPAGTIVSYQPWIQRRPWDDSIDTEVTRTMPAGYTFWVVKLTSSGFLYVANSNMQEWNDFNAQVISPGNPGSFALGQKHASTSENTIMSTSPLYVIPGGYSTDKETTAAIFNVINNVGTWISNEVMSPEPVLDTTTAPTRNLGFAEYDINRHDFT